MNDNLLENSRVLPSDITKKFSLRGKTEARPVYRIPLDLLYYNDKNGRIATLISKWEAENGYKISELERDKYNETIENYIIKSNEPAYKRTKNNIKIVGQMEAGVVLSNGCVIDGNRRYTCLRKLNAENSNGEFGYFEAVILDPDITADAKEIKRLELELQLGKDEKVTYNPVETLIDVYKTIEDEKILSIKEYADNSNTTESAIKKQLEMANIIVDFLDYINASGQYYIAVDLQLDASVNEIYNIKKNMSEDEWEKAKVVLYDNMLVKPIGDIKFMMRDIKKIANSEYFDEYYNSHEEIANKIQDILQETDSVDSNYINNKLRSDESLKESLNESCIRYVSLINIDNAKRLPIEQIEDVYNIISKIDVDAISHINGEDKEEFKERYESILTIINEIGSRIDDTK